VKNGCPSVVKIVSGLENKATHEIMATQEIMPHGKTSNLNARAI
jgi:hypothetical protein